MDRTDFTNKPVHVMFFDQGAGSLSVSVVSYHNVVTNDKRRPNVLQIRVKSVAWDKELGGLAFDAVVAKMITR